MKAASVRLASPGGARLREVPYPDFLRDDKKAIEAALRIAWERLPSEAASEGKHLASLPEVEITELLKKVLDTLLDETSSPAPEFSSGRFETVIRGGEIRDHTGMLLEKRPDLVFRYSGAKKPGVMYREHHGLFVECKIIDATHPERLYGQHGIRRFVSGEYAWVMPSAMMVAYVRNNSTVLNCLVPHLRKVEFDDEYRVKALPVIRDGEDSQATPIYVSKHARPDVKAFGSSPGDIEIAHLWLAVG
jgi:hypothetical protein